jgi:type VI secretion system secreted protein VgrG
MSGPSDASSDSGSSNFTQNIQYFALTTKLDTSPSTDTFVLTQVDGEEAISRLFLYRLKMFSTNDKVKLSDLIGQSATITIQLDDGTQRYITGIMTSCELSHYDDRDDVAYYEAELRPWLWLMTLSGDCKIFQNIAVPDIITQVCQAAGFQNVTKSLVKTYDKREYCVQYEESDFNFLARLMEREGIFYYFTHANGTLTLVLGDDASAFKPCASVSTLNYRPLIVTDTDDTVVRTVRYEHQDGGVQLFKFRDPDHDTLRHSPGQDRCRDAKRLHR